MAKIVFDVPDEFRGLVETWRETLDSMKVTLDRGPKDGFVSQLHLLRFLHECDSSYGALTFTPVGLSPTEQTSLGWTHSLANC